MTRRDEQRDGQADYSALRIGGFNSDKVLPPLLAWIDQVLPNEERHPDVQM
ncbi:hypothetical protein [Lentzea jiangxiensis]|uniref:hypothetical protein n=1 Tax=Lentzea jiangxiensis TaxID=641025 RepID=UPI0015A49C40|nr:hypothetical protein [Lentzea jiangxiensis]